MMDIPEHRTCNVCGASKPYTDFPFVGRAHHANAPRQSTCRKCCRARNENARKERVRVARECSSPPLTTEGRFTAHMFTARDAFEVELSDKHSNDPEVLAMSDDEWIAFVKQALKAKKGKIHVDLAAAAV